MHLIDFGTVSRASRRLARLALILLPLLAAGCATELGTTAAKAKPGQAKSMIDWPAFMARQDMVWTRLPNRWESGAFMGNGLVGANVYTTSDSLLMWRIGRTDVIDRGNRIPIGDLVLKTAGKLEGCDLRLDLWNAELKGTIKTDKGTIEVRTFTHADQPIQVIEMHPSDGEKGFSWQWLPGEAINPRYRNKKERIPAEEVNPAPQLATDGGVTMSVQPLKLGGGHVAAWTSGGAAQGDRAFYVTVGYSTKDIQAARQEALASLKKAQADGIKTLVASQREWWNDFWKKSFLSIPDTRMENFYTIQLYKMASGTRADRPMLDLMGPWFRTTPWPRIWFNLNIQLTYWPQLVSNHLELGDSLLRGLVAHKDNLAKNARPYEKDSYAIGRSASYDLDRAAKPEVGDLPWTLHNCWLQYRFGMDDKMLREQLFPLLKGSINYYLNMLKTGSDGYLHIPFGLSPEYPNQPSPNPDCNYDLSLLRWGCQTLLEICKRLKIDDPLIPKWKTTLEKLVPYPTDENGLMISASVPFKVSHRHYSHLLMVYPLHIMSLEQPENKDLVTKTVNYWMNLDHGSALRGYSFTGASSISALMGRGDDAAMYLNKLLDGSGRYIIYPNTMYTEAGPVVETPLSGAKSVQDMILTSWGNKIRVFPAIPGDWKDVAFDDLRAEGAFLVSAVRKSGQTQFVRIESLAGEPCRIVTDLPDPKAEGFTVTKVGDNDYTVDLKKGQTAVLTSGGRKTDLTIAPVPSQKDKENYYGRNSRTPALTDR